MAGWFDVNAPQNTGVTGGMLGPAVPATGQTPSTSMGLPPSYAAGPNAGGPVVGGLMPDGSFNANPYNYDKSQGPFIDPASMGIDPNAARLQGASAQGGGGADYQSEFMDAVKQLGIAPQQLRANPALMDKVSNFLNQKYPGQNWANGGARAGDWFSVNGQGFDVLPSGDRNYQWLSDPANSTAGSGGNLPPGYWSGTTTGGGMYPLAAAGGPGLATPWTTPFTAPDNITEQNDPGFQARMKMGTDAIQRSAAAKGTLLTGGLLKGLDRYAQDYASNEYSNVYNRALGQYKMAYDIFNNNGNNLFNRLGYLGSVGENAAAGVGNAGIGLGNAQAQGSTNQGSIWGNAVTNAGNTAGQLVYMNQMLNPKQGQPNPIDYTGTTSGYGQYQPAGTFTP